VYLKRLEIFGFKSFADKTVFNFGSGITAVIGPNGCGKSNVFDAIRWVLGEQSVKELRGSSMEDVIFNGTDQKPALGFAEVSLTFSNESRVLPYEYNEVTVTRRLFRSGESEYLINKTPVRLKDITEMFMGTGVGAEAYSMVQQGKVDLIVSARPEDRRVLLDEASGITKYKTRKREALNRLRDTENNLLRINDIVTEVKRQIASSERQAKKARRYKEEFEKLKVLEVRFAQYELSQHQGERSRRQEHLDQLKEKEAQLHAELEEFKNLIEHESVILDELEEKINAVYADQIKIDGQIDLNNKQIGFNEERLQGLSSAERRIQETKQQLEERCRQQREKIEHINQFLSGLDQSLQGNLQALEVKRQALAAINRSVEEAQHEIRQKEEQILFITSEQVKVKNKLTDSMKQVQGCLARQRRLEVEHSKVSSEKNEIDQKFSGICQKIEQVTGAISGLGTQLRERRAAFDEVSSQMTFIDGMIDDLDRKKLFLISQKEFIEKLSAQYQDIPDPVAEGRLVTDRVPLQHQSGIIGKVKEVRPLDAGNMGWLSQQFGQDGRQLYEIICETKFIELDPAQVSARIDELARQITEKSLEREGLNSRSGQMKAEISALESQLQEREKESSVYQAQRSDIAQEVDKLNQELELLRMELDEVATSLEAHHSAENVLTNQLQTLNQDLDHAQHVIRERQESIRVKGQEREATTVSIAQLEAEINSVEDKRSSYLENLRTFSEAFESAQSELLRLDHENEDLFKRREQYRQEIDQIVQTIEQLKVQRQEYQTELHEQQTQKEEVARRLQSVKGNILGYEKDLDAVRAAMHDEQMKEQQIGFRQKEVRDRLFQTYRIDLDHLETAEGLDLNMAVEGISAEGPFNPEELNAVVERLRRRCESFGSVNLVAIEEFDELKERFEFLTRQQADLITAKESLHKTIQKINRETRQMFMNTFTKVSEEFRIYFRMLFGGGEAQLLLLDPENVLESGIDIIARPPGKKRQNISLLSGGEKTLTAIALIFGVFKVNPSPFCVLDEIDAALDESNVGRYSYLLKDFAKIAQFIIITHNKKTIASADVMYGITMQQTGVSKLVSVKFSDQKEEQAEAVEVPAAV